MSRTVTYSRLHAAFLEAAEVFDVEPMVARLALAIAEDGNAARTDDLARVLGCPESMVRRAVLRLYGRDLAVGLAVDGGPRRPGKRTVVRLTQEGRRLAGLVVTTAAAAEELAA